MVDLNASSERRGVALGLSWRNLSFPLLCIAALASVVSLYWIGMRALGESWMTPEYSHGPLIPLLSFFMLLRQMRMTTIHEEAINDRWPGVVLAALSLTIAMLANIARIPDIASYALILFAGSLVLLRFGWRQGLAFWPPVLHLVFMLSLPAFMFWKVSITLQFWSSELGVFFIQLLGIPVYLDGNIIDLGVYKLHVAEACSGLRYLFPILSFSYIFSVLYTGPMWHKAILLLSAAPITILMNSVRIAFIGVIVDNYGIEHAEGFMHFFEGWVIFIICVLMLFGLAMLLQRLQKEPKPLAEALDLSFEGMGDEARRLFTNTRSVAMTFSMAMFVAVAVAWHATPEREPVVVERAPFVLFPREIGGWAAGPSQPLPPNLEHVLGADDYRTGVYSKEGEAASVEFFSAYYDDLASAYGIHSPEICIPAGGWEMSTITQVPVSSADGSETFEVNRAVIQWGLNKQIVYFWFEQRGRQLTHDVTAKFYTLYDSVVRGRADGALVRYITPVVGDETEADAEARLNRFLQSSMDVIPRFIPN